MEFERAGRPPHHFLTKYMHRCSELLECHPQIHYHTIAKLSIHKIIEAQTHTFHLYKYSNTQNLNLKTSEFYYHNTTHLYIHMCAQLQILKRFGIFTFSGYEIVGELHPSHVTIGVRILANLADFHQCTETHGRVSCGLRLNKYKMGLFKYPIPRYWRWACTHYLCHVLCMIISNGLCFDVLFLKPCHSFLCHILF